MTWWNNKVTGLKEAVEKEKVKSTPKERTSCIHGETNCVRCMTEDFSMPLGMTWEFLDDTDIKQVIYSLPETIVKMLRRYAGTSVLAGGYIRAIVGNEEVNDIDIFVPTKAVAEDIALNVIAAHDSSDKHFQCRVEDTEVQIIWRYPYKEAREILEQFDYTVAKAAIWFDEGTDKIEPNFNGICHHRFYRDIARKLLVYECDREVERVQSIPRLLKYTKYGYSIEPDSLADVITKTCLSLDLTNGFEGMRKQLEDCYRIAGHSGLTKRKDWKDMTEKYVKPVPRSYSYGS